MAARKYVTMVNTGLSPRSFRLAVDKRQRVQDRLLVRVPGRDPESDEPGVSDPVPIEYIEAEKDNEALVRLFDEGVLRVREVT